MDRIDHVRRPDLPWRKLLLTECGLPITGHPAISREVFLKRLKEEGKQRTAMQTCMTCFDTAQRHPCWSDDPVQAIAREVYTWKSKEIFRRELLALAALVERHHEQFAELLEDQLAIVSLSKRRERAQ